MIPEVAITPTEDLGWQLTVETVNFNVGNTGHIQKSQCVNTGKNIFRTKVDIRDTGYIKSDETILIELDLEAFLLGSFILSTDPLPTLTQEQIDAGKMVKQMAGFL